MKRAVTIMPLPPKEREFELALPQGAEMKSFIFTYAEKKIVTGIVGQNQRVMEEIPAALVLLDPDASTETRKFVVAEEGQIVESDGKLLYIGSAMSQASQGKVFHLFEEEFFTTIQP